MPNRFGEPRGECRNRAALLRASLGGVTQAACLKRAQTALPLPALARPPRSAICLIAARQPCSASARAFVVSAFSEATSGARRCSRIASHHADSASERPDKNAGAPKTACATRESWACLMIKLTLLAPIAARCFRISEAWNSWPMVADGFGASHASRTSSGRPRHRGQDRPEVGPGLSCRASFSKMAGVPGKKSFSKAWGGNCLGAFSFLQSEGAANIMVLVLPRPESE